MNTGIRKTIKVVSSNKKSVLCSNGEECIDVSIQNFPNICRFCLFGPPGIDMFLVEYQKTPIHNICMSQFSIMINPKDGLPTHICKKCENTIRDFSSFRTSVLAVEHILKEVLENEHKYTGKTSQKLFIKTSDYSQDNFESPVEDNCKNKGHGVRLKCRYCNKMFIESLEYKKHVKEEREQRKDLFSSCTVCKKLYPKRKLVTHMKVHSKIKVPQTFQCDICGKNYKTKRNLNRHYLTHAGMPHVCEVCGKGFREANLLTDHMNLHSGFCPYLCSFCGKSYATSSALRLHRAYNHNGLKRKYYKYAKKTGTRPRKPALKSSFPCEICGKVYSSRTTVNYHVLTHSEEKKFQCNDCGKMFANRGILGDHRRIHRLSYKCTYCERSFAYAASLETHINSHTGEKPHHCATCGKRYSNRSHLKEHMRNHTGERPYSCTLCGKTFAVKGNLNAHLKMHAKHMSVT